MGIMVLVTYLDEEYGFYDHVKDCADAKKPCQLYVFDPKSKDTRLISVLPTYEWGGQGCLGADVGFGLLHRLVEQDPNFDELLQQNEDNMESEGLLVDQTSEVPLQTKKTPEVNVIDPTTKFANSIQQKDKELPKVENISLQAVEKVEPISKPVPIPQPIKDKPATPYAQPRPPQKAVSPIKTQKTAQQPIPVEPVQPVDEWSNIGQPSESKTVESLFNSDLSKPIEDELSELISGDLR